MQIDEKKMESLLKEVGKLFFDDAMKKQAAEKGYGNYVTLVDQTVQQKISEALKKEYPDVQMLAEEKDNSTIDVHGSFWILDPVDGTMNLMRGYRHSAISLGYAKNGVLSAGFIYDPFADEYFSCRKGGGAFCNGKPIHTSKADGLKESIVFAGTSPYHKELADWYFDAYRDVYHHCQDIRRSGSAVLDLAWIACGRLEAYFEHVYPWDRAAGTLLVQEAGGAVYDLNGRDAPVTGFAGILAANSPKTAKELLALLKNHPVPPIMQG